MKQPDEMTDYSKLTDNQMDVAMATDVMGWTVGGDMFLEPLPSISPSVEPWWDTVIFREDWQPTTNLNQARECLEMIIGECKEEEFIHALIAKLDLDCSIFPSALEGSGYSGNVPECIVAMMTAKPRAICEAVLMAKRGEG